MGERFNENAELDYTELEVFVPELEDLHGKVERGMGPEQQRDLTEEEFNVLTQKDTLTKDEMKAVVKYANKNDYHELYLGLKTLDVGTARALAEFKGKNLSLDGITSLDVETGRALAEFKGWDLSLDGVTSLDVETARVLAEFKGWDLSLDGVTSLDVETARALAEFKGDRLSLSGITSLDVETARALAEFGRELYLDGVTSLDREIAAGLAKSEGFISLGGVTSLDREIAAGLVKSKGSFSLDGVTSLDVETARALANFEGYDLSLRGVKNVSDEVAGILIPIKSKTLGDELKNRINEVEKKIMEGGLNGLQRIIENTKKKKDWKNERGNVEYNEEEHEIMSWGNTVKVERKSKDSIKLGGLEWMLTLEEGMWLANFKNWFKHTYPGQQVEFKKDRLNRSFELRKTLCVGNKMLMSRDGLRERLPFLRDDDLVEVLVDWLNN